MTWSISSRSRSPCRIIRSSARSHLTLRDEQNHRFAANFVNLVVKPDRPLPRIQRRNDHDVTIRFAPRDLRDRSGPIRREAPSGKVYGRGKGFFEYRIEIPPSVVKAHPESFYYLFQAGSKAKRERVDWPERVNRQDYPQTDQARTWSSTLAILVNGRPVDRITLPDDSADARGVLSHLAGVEHGKSRRAGRWDGRADRPRPRGPGRR